VLVLDDEPAIRELLCGFLEPAGYKVVKTDDGRSALETVEKGEVDLAIVDLQMPKMSGEEFLSRVAALPEDKRPACLALTGRLTDTGTTGIGKLGVYDVLAKPFKGSTVRECAYAALKARGRLSAGN
jgi:DNA-binding response OmpR family regulator